MRQTFFLLLSFLLSPMLAAQSVTVKGKLVSASDQEPLPYATISVAKQTDPGSSIKKLATAENGTFSTEIDPGDYILTFDFVGMSSVKTVITLTGSESFHDMGEIEMEEGSTQLDELSVTAQAPLVKVEIDKITYSAKDDPESATSNVLDLLRKVPLVTVDGEEEIQLKGSGNFKIYLNGKPSNMISGNPSQVLKSMPANSVKEIEVITDPGAKYDAEGVGGIINIVTDKRADDGYTGSVGANGNTFGGYGANAYLATKYGKFGFAGTAGYYRYLRPASESVFTREEFDPMNRLSLEGTSENDGNGLFLNGSMSFEPDTMNLFNLSASRFGGGYNSLSRQKALSEGIRPYSYHSLSNSKGEYGGINLSADYQRNFKRKGEMLTLSYRYENNPNDSEYDSRYDDVEGGFYYPDGYWLRSANDAGGNEHTGQVDYVNPLNGKHSIEAGLKYIFRDNSSRTDNTYYDAVGGQWLLDEDKKNDLDHSQNIFSGYGGYAYKSGKLGFKAGLRMENTQQDIHFMSFDNDTVVNTSFFDLVPSLTLSYQLGMTRTLRGGYNMRISRPGIWHLNPYVNDVDPNNISYGNPHLDAEQQHNFNINYGSFSQKLNFNATLSYSFAKNAVTRYSFIEAGVTHNTYGNIGRNHTVGTNVYLSWAPTQMLRTYLNGGVNYIDIQSEGNQYLDEELRNNGFTGRAFGGLTFTFPRDFRMSANGGLFMNQVQLQTEQSPFYFYSFSLLKSFLNKKLDLSLNAQNIFSKYINMTTTTEGKGFTQESLFLNPVRELSLSVTYRFGELKTSMKRVQRGISNEDVLEGGSSGQESGAATGGGSQ